MSTVVGLSQSIAQRCQSTERTSQSTYPRPIRRAALVPVLLSCSLLSCRGALRGEANPGAVALSIYCTDTNLMLFNGNSICPEKNHEWGLQAFCIWI